MKFVKPKLRKAKDTESMDEGYNSHLAVPGGEIIEETSGRDTAASIALTLGGGIKFILGLLVFALLVVGSIYTFLAGTLMFTAPSEDSSSERIWVARGTFQGGQIDAGTTVYGSASDFAGRDFIGKVKEGYVGAKDYFVVDTIAGPVAEVSSKNGVILVNGSATKFKGEIETTRLSKQYLAQCVEGSCAPGEYVVVDYDSIAGEVRGVISLTGLSDIHDK